MSTALVPYDPDIRRADDEVEELRAVNRELRQQLAEVKRELSTARADAASAVKELRTLLTPLYRGLQRVFGELDTIGDSASGAPVVDDRTSAIWQSWKAKLPGRTAQIIDALLLHGSMNSTQIAIAIGIHRNNVPPLIHKLNKAGLIDKNGHNYSLKPLR